MVPLAPRSHPVTGDRHTGRTAYLPVPLLSKLPQHLSKPACPRRPRARNARGRASAGAGGEATCSNTACPVPVCRPSDRQSPPCPRPADRPRQRVARDSPGARPAGERTAGSAQRPGTRGRLPPPPLAARQSAHAGLKTPRVAGRPRGLRREDWAGAAVRRGRLPPAERPARPRPEPSSPLRRPPGSVARPRPEPCPRLRRSRPRPGGSHLRPRLGPAEVTTHRPEGWANQALNFPATSAIYRERPGPRSQSNALTR